MKILSLFISFLLIIPIFAQEEMDLSIYKCYQLAKENHPLLAQKIEQQKLNAIKIEDLNTLWFPKMELNASINYISDIMNLNDVNLPIPATFPEMPHDQYKLTMDINQTLYDGGYSKLAKNVAAINLEINLQNIDVSLYQINERINAIYFSILLLDINKQLVVIFKKEIEQKIADLKVGYRNGLILPENIELLEAELIKIQQQITEIEIREKSAYILLGTYTGEDLSNKKVKLNLPEIQFEESNVIERPEKQYFALQKKSMDASKELIQSSRMPKAFAFATMGYGNPPGNNFLADEFDFFYMIGAGIKWNIYDWKNTKRKKQSIDIQKNILSTKEHDFDRNISLALQNQISEISKIESLIESDQKLIQLREKISKTTSSKLENGYVNSTDYISAMNAERQARLNFEVHIIQLAQAKINYITISGKLNQIFIKE